MAKIFKGNIEFGLMFKPNGAQPLDDRVVVASVDDLKAAEGIFDNGTTYAGMVVATKDTGDLYVCLDPNAELFEKRWKKIGSDVLDAGKVTVEQSEGRYVISQNSTPVGYIETDGGTFDDTEEPQPQA